MNPLNKINSSKGDILRGTSKLILPCSADNNGQLVKLDFLKTLDFHQNRTYKGLDVTVRKN